MTTAPNELFPEPGGVPARINARGSAVFASPSAEGLARTELCDPIQQVHDAMRRRVHPRIELEER
jgi:hypothetical protein